MKDKIVKPTEIEIKVHSETGGTVEYMNVLYGSVYPFYHRNPKAPNYKGKCTLELDGREIELELAIWNRDYGLSLNGTLIRLVDTVPTKKQKREYD